jgi:hypothetical protein
MVLSEFLMNSARTNHKDMSQTTQNISDYMSAFWESVIGNDLKKGNAFLIKDKLTQLYTEVERRETQIKDSYIDPLLEKLHVESDVFKELVKSKGFFKEIEGGNINVAGLYNSFQAVDVSNKQSVDNFISEVNKAIDDLLKNSSDVYLIQVKDSTQKIINTVTDFLYYLSEEDQSNLQTRVNTLINEIADWISVIGGLDPPQKAYLVSMMQRSDLVISILSPYQRSAEDPIPPKTRNERIEQFKENLPKAEAEIKKGKLPNNQDIKDLYLVDFFDAGTGFTDIQSYDSVQNISQQLRDAIVRVFDVLDKIYAENSTTDCALVYSA